MFYKLRSKRRRTRQGSNKSYTAHKLNIYYLNTNNSYSLLNAFDQTERYK